MVWEIWEVDDWAPLPILPIPLRLLQLGTAVHILALVLAVLLQGLNLADDHGPKKKCKKLKRLKIEPGLVII